MTKTANWINYKDRLSRVTAYIHEHHEEDIDFVKLAEIACLSPYHWHRIYRAVYGETLAATVRRLRLHHAAGRLTQSTMSIEDIAHRAGCGSQQAFTRAFSAAYGMPPAQFRKEGTLARFRFDQNQENTMSGHNVEIKELAAMRLASLPHTGPYMEIGKVFDALFGIFATRNLLRGPVQCIGIGYDDPASVPAERLRSRACIVVGEDFIMEPPLEEAWTTSGPHAVMVYKGPYSGLEEAYHWLYREWLVKSGREPADAPPFEEYLNNPRETAPSELLTAIHVPLK